ncbi:hypothetical protein SKAU_G00141890 [Synaphobranchus kaupii]|uniref:Uncharacterized protein n=1 Tax=Synaphobranchus kaupii TaxID=118154 RepID=A0A9Q1J4C2_SYNKA|nr:hypothetical protein SKAU_G00141890 [Synaphobranchus kaupii]
MRGCGGMRRVPVLMDGDLVARSDGEKANMLAKTLSGEAGGVRLSAECLRQRREVLEERRDLGHKKMYELTKMDSADSNQLKSALDQQGVLLRRHQSQLDSVVSVLVDSGAEGNFMDADLVSQLPLPSVPLQDPLEALVITDSLEREAVDLSTVPPVYLDLREVCSKSRTTSLPPHRLYDCAIDLPPGKSPP